MRPLVRRTSRQPSATPPSATRKEARSDAGRRLLVQLGGVLLGAQTDGETRPPGGRKLLHAAGEARSRARLADELALGASLEDAVLAALRDSSDAALGAGARSLLEGVGRISGGERAKSLGLLYLGHRKKWWSLAEAALDQLDDLDVARYLPVAAAEVMLRDGDAQRVSMLLDHVHEISTGDLVALAARVLVVPDKTLAERLVTEVRRRDDPLDRAHRHQLGLVEGWLAPADPSAAAPSGAVRVGVLDYNQPDQTRASKNVGDYVQTLAMLGHLARFSGCSFTGPDGLGDFLGELQARVTPSLRVREPAAAVHAVPVNRDASALDDLDEPVWTIAFGWYMHPQFGIRYDFPFAEAIRPIFVSFHVHQSAILDSASLDYLRRHGPIGCRDWTTVYLLLGAGVPAFFSGCLTTTLDMTFPSRDEVAPQAPLIGAVDVPPRVVSKLQEPWEQVRHAGQGYREATVTAGLRAAQELLAGYQERYSELVTSRLHAYLPATALGVPVRFRPATRSDIRFEGLLGLKPGNEKLTEIQDGLRSLLSEALRPVLEGASEDEVYDRWRQLTAPAVAEAQKRFEQTVDAPVREDVDAGVATVREHARLHGPDVRVAGGSSVDVHLTVTDGNLDQLAVTVESLLANASGRVRLWVTSRGVDEAQERSFAESFSDTTVTFLPCDRFEHRLPRRLSRPAALATRDRLLVPELLPDVGRVVSIEVGAVVLGDVAELAAMDLGGHPFAARTTEVQLVTSWRAAGASLPPPLASELRRGMAARHAFGARAIDAGVLVMDLERMRADRFTQRYIALGERYQLNVRDTLLAYVGAERADLDPRWNSWPASEILPDPQIVQYLGAAKPWRPGLVPGQEHWDRYADTLGRRAGATAPGPDVARPVPG